ncbi:hypothetical protein SAMN05660742_111112 [Propionispira arboris]|uniref:Uncharacterized protein n=1 Tax=Propionispira arboris TaxID=84035 RepID=A0A1H7A893_9FIRM|nr:hypothetical protein [Propionispira arboris]SEJ60107.1 hypothetical protein SAMN05660742_111112 [Propionispira arboris]
MKKGLIIISIIVLFLFLLFEYYLKYILNYQDVDYLIKALAGFGAIGTAWGVYWKWNDEKTRQLYERRLQEVYAPLCKIIINQEEYRAVMVPDADREKYPVLNITTKRIETKFEFKDTVCKETTSVIDLGPGVVNNKDFFKVLEKSNYGLARPGLLILIARYALIIGIYEDFKDKLSRRFPKYDDPATLTPEDKVEINKSPEGVDLLKVVKRRCQVERSLVTEIINGYNKTVKRLGLDDQKIDLDEETFLGKN